MANILTGRVSPIHISFPLHRRPPLTVSVWRRFTHDRKGNLLSIEVTNVGSAPVEIAGMHVGFMHTFLPAELLLGTHAARLPLHDLDEVPQPPYVLGAHPLKWTVDLDPMREQLVAEQLRNSPRLRRIYAELTTSGYPHLDRFYTELADIEPEMNRGPRGRLAITINNISRELVHKQFAVIIQYGQGGLCLYKAKARLEPPPWAQRHRPH